MLELPGIVGAVVLSRGSPLPITRFGLGEGRGLILAGVNECFGGSMDGFGY